MLETTKVINCNGQLLDLSSPKIMGILNVTPDSFYDGGRYQNEHIILKRVEKMLEDGASIIDIGGMSSRPGAKIITIEEELKRVLPVVGLILKYFPQTIISVDTVRGKIAKEVIQNGGSIVNDVSAGSLDETLFQTVADLNVPYILMHMKGIPKNMQDRPNYDDVVLQVTDFMIEKVGQLKALGVKDIILDVGFGFGKSIEHNYQLLKNMHQFKILGLSILTGISRKSMIYKLLETTPEKALNGTSALHMIALQQGASILRVHDVKEAMEVIKLWEIYDLS